MAARLICDGRTLDAQARCDDVDAATMLREHSYVQPGTDTDIADVMGLPRPIGTHDPDGAGDL